MTDTKTLDPDTAAIIRESLSAAHSGNLERACGIAEQGLQAGGDAAALNAMLGVLRCRSGDLGQGVTHLRTALEMQPQDLTIATNLAAALIEQGDHKGAMTVATHERAKADSTLRLMRFRGFAAQSAGDFAQAVEAYEQVVEGAPNDWEAWNNLGNARTGIDDHQGSVTALRRAVELNPVARPVRLNFAMALGRAGEVAEAEVHLRGMADEFPEDAQPLRELHAFLKEQLREDEALEAIEEAARRDPGDMELLLAVASQRLMLLRTDDAEAAYREVVDREPANALAHLGLAVVFELTNRTEALSLLVREAEERGVGKQATDFIRAFDHRRAKRYAEGLAVLEQIPEELETARRYHLLGQLYEGTANYGDAFEAYLNMNRIRSDEPSRPQERAAVYRNIIRNQAETVNSDWLKSWREPVVADERASPAFLIGFPRSGTTLLDTMLMGHPAIEVLEEEPTLRNATKCLPVLASLPAASDAEIQAARDAYFETAAALTPLAPGKLLVDKNPLSMNALPVIRRLFPDARIILALRHPCDVVLSCFATNFKLNDGMASFIQIDTAAELYDLSFNYLERAQKLFDMPMHRIVYENIVSDRETELRSLLNFLSLDWNDDLLDHQTTALGRGRIKTASYAQVAEPIYTRAAGRWEHYREHLEPVLPVLEPWIRKFGYTV